MKPKKNQTNKKTPHVSATALTTPKDRHIEMERLQRF